MAMAAAAAAIRGFSGSDDPMGAFPSSPLVVRRDKRRRRQRKAQHTSASESRDERRGRSVRQGFVFDEPRETKSSSTAASSAGRESTARASQAFVFKAKKMNKKKDAEAEKQERAARLELKRQRMQQKKEEQEAEEKYEATLQDKLTDDQLELFQIVRELVKREIRKTKRDFASSAARADILKLTEKGLHTLRDELVAFMIENRPSTDVVTAPNPENARLSALIESYEERIRTLDGEEGQWTEMLESLETSQKTAEEEDQTMEPERVEVKCELKVVQEVEKLQKNAITQVETSARRLGVIEDSMKTVDRLLLQAEMKKSKLFDAFHSSAFKGYNNIEDPKETLRALLKLAPPKQSMA
ncbi:hypothetical protein Poli38472_010038 [Pythium oligandrum]|uniref:Uncharacterized protein n=1 Tax=Pythium oligandrum TaxID=41045 RepID=A0A8K1C881_PYTOL|nr:hypothetical protein Poli38472_010038 [Pythium oligandrum]|eukprot:TMW58479.1 hypothetical protein Poli38472_010038 [Pythium oligandrum]